MRYGIRASVAVVLLMLLAGCISPVAYRIRKHPELFASFPPEVQDNVRAGRVEIGYTQDMVYMAMGRPDRRYTRKTESGRTRIWSYTEREYTTGGWVPVETLYVYRDALGRRRYGCDVSWIDATEVLEFEAIRIEFADDNVKAIEILKR